jgi:biotin operon repressor
MPYVPQEAIDIFSRPSDNTAKDVLEAGIKTWDGDPCSDRTARRWKRYFTLGVAEPGSVELGRESEITDGEILLLHKLIKNKPMSLRELSEALDRSTSSVKAIIGRMEDEGYNIASTHDTVQVLTNISVRKPDIFPSYLADSMVVRMAIFSDWHCGSKHQQITALRHSIRTARERGYRLFMVPGDLTAGYRVYAGQDIDLYAHTSEAQEKAFERELQPLPDETWVVLGGNHDFSWLKRSSIDVVWRVCNKYDNVYFVGYDQRDIPITDQFSVRLWHPSGGVPYAVSYRLQKGMENLAYESLTNLVLQNKAPTIRAIFTGHLHIEASLFRGGILGLQVPCYEGRNGYLLQKGLRPEIGGYLVDFHLNDAGKIVRIAKELLTYSEVDDDYLNYEPIDEYMRPVDEEVLYSVIGKQLQRNGIAGELAAD